MIGSFLNVVIYRLPRLMPLGLPRSKCTNCNKLVYWYENIPIISYSLLRGKCSGCRTKISVQYPIIEFVTGLFSLFLFFEFRETFNFNIYIFKLAVFSIFLCIFVTDVKHKIIPDILNLYLALIFFAYSFLYLNIYNSIIGAVLAFSITYGVTWFFYQIKGKVGLGGGDIKLFTALAVYLGPIGIIYNITASCALGAIVGLFLIGMKIISSNQYIPFGPFIIIVSFIQIFFTNYFKLIFNY